MNFRNEVEKIANDVCTMLIEKNESYGNSALDPVRVFSKADGLEQIKVRIDDKLSRMKRGKDIREDDVKDLIGYLFLLRIGLKKCKNKKEETTIGFIK